MQFLSFYLSLWSYFLSQEVQELAQEAAQRVVLVIDEEGVETLLSELLKGVSDSQVCLLALLIKYITLACK